MRTFGAAAFLACSWFWCIGGFFPVILRQEFGDAAFPWFAALNVVGATAFGFVWSNAQRTAFLDRHLMAARVFSGVVVVFHLWFVIWICGLLGAVWPAALYAAATGLTAALKRRETALAVILLAATALIFIHVASAPGPAAPAGGTAPFGHQILPLALGFMLAPYFDLTFHDVFRAAPRPRLAFALGTGCLFAACLAGMHLAAPTLARLADGGAATGALGAMVALLAVQTGFTTAIHAARIGVAPRLLAAGAGGAAAILAAPLAGALWIGALWPVGVVLYKSFVFVIGGLFPLVLLFAGRRRAGLAAAAFITPCYALGFLIGGEFAPLLSAAMAGLAAIWAVALRAPRPVGRS